MKKPGADRWRLAGRILFLIVLLLGSLGPSAGEAETARADGQPSPPGQFIIRLRPVHAQERIQEQDKARIVQHYQYLQKLLAEGKLILAGLATDDYQEIVVVRAGDRLEAEGIMAGDPAVGGNLYRAEVHPFRVVFPGEGK